MLCLLQLLALGAPALRAQDVILGVIPAGVRPVAVSINPVTGQAFVLNKGSQDISVIDIQTRTTVMKYKIGGVPEAIAVNPKTNSIVVVSSTGSVSIIDHAQSRIAATIPVGKTPSRVAIDVEKNAALVTDFSGSKLAVIDLSERKVSETISLRSGPVGVVVLEGKRRALVAAQYDMELLQIDLDRLSVEDKYLVGRYISELGANQVTGLVVVGNPSSNGIISIYDPKINSILSTLPVGDGPLSIAVYAKKNMALISEFNSGTVALVDLGLYRVIQRIPVAKGPLGIAIHPDTGVAIVVNNLADSATFIDIERVLAPPPPPPPSPSSTTPPSLPPPTPKEPEGIFVLLEDPSGKVGQIGVANSGGAQVLTGAGAATEVANATTAPATPFIMDREQIGRIFGEVLAAQPQSPVHYTLYFDLNSARLTSESRRLISEIVRLIRERNSNDISVIGHCDALGNREYNNKLSLMRAQAVGKSIIAEGIDPSALDIASHGQDNPLISIAAGKPAPRNRRVEITVR